jgi:zinc protease
MLMNLILGGDEFVGRIGKRVRDTEGLAYYAYTTFAPGLEAGPWMFRAGVNPRNIPRALASAKEEVRKMVAQGVTASELAWAKDHAIGALRLSLATNEGVAEQQASDAFYGLGLDYAQQMPQIVRSLTKAQVNAAARAYLRPEALTVVIAGPPMPAVAKDGKP